MVADNHFSNPLFLVGVVLIGVAGEGQKISTQYHYFLQCSK